MLTWLAPILLLSASALAQDCGSTSTNHLSCPLNTCCSGSGYCGTTEPYCNANCQTGFGSCGLPTVPSCPSSGKSATNGRRIGYWSVRQAWERPCDKVLPNQIRTAGLTHLVLGFAHFDPTTFQVGPADDRDRMYYSDFVGLSKTSPLKTWVAIGGGGFAASSWTAMAKTPESRSKFTTSLLNFTSTYGFQGVDLDWEFPREDGSDAQNLVALTKDLRAKFGAGFGISAAIPADWGSIKGFDIADMAGQVDFFNFMAYDLHIYKSDQPDTHTVRYPADIVEIGTDMRPLWSNGTRPGQVNLGVPYYGRGYTLSDPTCNTVGCMASAASSPGQCAVEAGVLSLDELKRIVPASAVVLDQTAMQKYAVYGQGKTQWIAFDDADTLRLKLGWANEHCLGGAFFWSMDFNGGGY